MLEMLWNLFPGNLRGEPDGFVEKFGGFILKKLKLGKILPCRQPPKDNLKASNESRQ